MRIFENDNTIPRYCTGIFKKCHNLSFCHLEHSRKPVKNISTALDVTDKSETGTITDMQKMTIIN